MFSRTTAVSASGSLSTKLPRLPKPALLQSPTTLRSPDGSAAAEEIQETGPVPWPVLERVHDAALVARIRGGGLSVREERGLGLPWSPPLVERGRRAVAGTLAAARHALEHGIGMNLGGG